MDNPFNNYGENPLVGFNFMLRVEMAFDLPCKSVRAFTREMEYELIQEGGLNDYVHMRRKPQSKPFTFEVERYVGIDAIDPLPLGAELTLPVLLMVGRMPREFIPFTVARTFAFFGCRVTKREFSKLEADTSGLAIDVTTIAYDQMMLVDIPWAEYTLGKAPETIKPGVKPFEHLNTTPYKKVKGTDAKITPGVKPYEKLNTKPYNKTEAKNAPIIPGKKPYEKLDTKPYEKVKGTDAKIIPGVEPYEKLDTKPYEKPLATDEGNLLTSKEPKTVYKKPDPKLAPNALKSKPPTKTAKKKSSHKSKGGYKGPDPEAGDNKKNSKNSYTKSKPTVPPNNFDSKVPSYVAPDPNVAPNAFSSKVPSYTPPPKPTGK